MKKEMKKVLLLIMILVFTLTIFTACSPENKETAPAPSNETPAPEASGTDAEPEPADKGIEGSLEGVEFAVGTSGLFAPFSYYDEDGSTLIGYDLDFIAELQDLLGFTIAGDTIEAMDYSALTTSVASGKLDIALAALCATDVRKEVMNFSNTYYDSGQIVTINKEDSPEGITGIDSLKTGDFIVAVEKGTASHLYAQANLPANSIEVHDTITTAYESLEQGKVDALIQDQPGIAFYIKTKDDTKLEMVGEEFNQGQAPYAIAVSFKVSEENPELLDILNKSMEELNANGTMDELKTKWFK